MKKIITFEDIKKDKEVDEYIASGNDALGMMGFTEHGYAHCAKVAELAGAIIMRFEGNEREAELARISGYMHDIGNIINRTNHAHLGALLARDVLTRMEMPYNEVCAVIGAIGNHDEDTGSAISNVCSALILADKSDVRRSRVRTKHAFADDIHARVNYAVTSSSLTFADRAVKLELIIDTDICSVIEYFKIFLNRMYMCQSAAHTLHTRFMLVINNTVLM